MAVVRPALFSHDLTPVSEHLTQTEPVFFFFFQILTGTESVGPYIVLAVIKST